MKHIKKRQFPEFRVLSSEELTLEKKYQRRASKRRVQAVQNSAINTVLLLIFRLEDLCEELRDVRVTERKAVQLAELIQEFQKNIERHIRKMRSLLRERH